MKFPPRLTLSLSLAVMILTGSSGSAADFIWDITPGTVGSGDSAITGGTGFWNLSNGNWTIDGGVNNVAWGNTNIDQAIFGGALGTLTIDTGSGVTANKLTFNSSGYAINGNVAADVLTMAGVAPTIDVTTLGHTATIGAVISGGSGLTKSGAGTLTLTGANNYTGGTTISNGILAATVNSTQNSLGSGAVSVGPGTTLQWNNTSTAADVTVGNTTTGTGQLIMRFTSGGGGRNTSISGINGFAGTITLAKDGAGASGDKWNSSANAPSAAVVIQDGTQLFTGGSTILQSVNIIGTGNIENRGAIRLSSNLTAPVTLAGNATIGAEGGRIIGNVSSSVAGPVTLTVGTSNSNNLVADMFQGAIADGAGTVSLRVFNENGGNAFLGGSRANTYSGGTTLVNSGGGTRLLIGSISSTPYGSGAITIGEAATDRAGIYFINANQNLANGIVFNTALGTDRAGIRTDVTGITLSGQVTANLAPATFSTNGTGSVNLTGKVTGPNGLTLDNSFGTTITVTLNNAAENNDYAGTTTIAGTKGILSLGRSNQIPNGAGKGNVNNLGTLRLNGFSETINGLTGNGIVDAVSGTSVLTVGDNNALGNFSGVLQNTAGSLSLVKTGTGRQILTGASTYSGTTTINGGALRLQGAANTVPISGAVYQLDASQASTLFQDAAGTTPVTTAGQSVGHWGEAGGGTNDFTQGTAANQPTYQTGQINGLAAIVFDGANSPNNDRMVLASATTVQTLFILNRPTALGGLDGIWGRAGQDFGVRAGGSTSWSFPGNGNDFANPGGSAMYINGIAGNTFADNTPHLLGIVRSSALALDGTAIGDYWGSLNRVYSGAIGEVLAYSTALSDSDRIRVEAYLGKKWQNQIYQTANILPTNTAVTIGATGALEIFDVNQTIASLTGVAGSSVVIGPGTQFTVGDSTSTAFAGVISGSGSFIKSGSGTLTLSGNNSFTGTTTINGGTLVLNTPNYNTYQGGQININGASTLSITQSGGATRYDFAGKTFNFNATGGGAITVGNGVNFVFMGTNTFVTNGGARNTISPVTSTGINMNNQSIAFNVVRGTDPTSDLTVSTSLGNSTGGLTKDGNGILTLTAANGYTGPTTVNQGILRVDGTITGTSSVTVASGAKLQGIGTITTTGGTTINGRIAPGNSIGTLTLAGPVTLSGVTATAEFEIVNPMVNGLTHTPSAVIMNAGTTFGNPALITGATRVAGQNDILIVNGATPTLTFNTGSTLEVLMLPNTPPTGLLSGIAWDLIDAGIITIGGANGFWGVANDYTYHGGNGVQYGDIILNLPDLWNGTTDGYYNWNLSLFESHGIIVLVPEPSRALFALLALLPLALRRRRM